MGYTQELRDEVLERVFSTRNPQIGKLAKEFGISRTTIFKWKKEAGLSGRLFCVRPETKISAMQQYFHLTGVLGGWLFLVRRVALFERATGSISPRFALTQGSTPIGNFFAGSAMELLGGRAGFPVCGIAALICLVPVVKRKKTSIRMWLKSEL